MPASGYEQEGPTDLVPARGRAGSRLVGIWSGGHVIVDLPSKSSLILGRSAKADIRIDHGSVSRLHARLSLGDDAAYVEDLGSANGTRVDGARLSPNAPLFLRAGALIEIGVAALVFQRAAEGASVPSLASPPLAGFVVEDPQMVRVGELVDVVARSKLSVLLLGETGVGKEVLATRVHERSPRARGPFIKVNCAALAESLLEAELFGYERGAFTGAMQAKLGLIEAAHGGTLFLDEIGELPLSTQAKLLRVLESGEVTRVGSVSPRKLDVRVVAATNVNLKDLVAAGRFRRDLYFRLEGASIHVPPLRARASEIALLADLFAQRACAEVGRSPVRIDPGAVAQLQRYDWPGNVRELRNVIARSVIFCGGATLGPSDLQFELSASPAPVARPSPPGAGDPAKEERWRIVDALAQCVGNQTRAAELLGISRRTLVNRLDALGLPRPRRRE